MQSWVHVVEWRANTRPQQVAVLDDRGVCWTYEELQRHIETMAGGLYGLGIERGDLVLLIAQNSAWYMVTALALARAGVIPLLVNWRLSATELAGLIELARPVAAIADEPFTSVVDDAANLTGTELRWHLVLPSQNGSATDAVRWQSAEALDGPLPPRPSGPLSANGTFAVLHTSGTTGRPKLIPLDNSGHIRSIAGFAIEIGDQVAESRHLQLMPLFHLAGFSQALQCFLTAGTLYVATQFEAGAVVDAVENDRIEFFTAAPSIIDMLIEEINSRPASPDLSSLREVQYGSAPIRPELLRRAIDVLNCRFRQIYGNSESQSTVTLLGPEDHQPDNPHLGSAGRLAMGWEARVVDHLGKDVRPGEPGELVIRSDCMFSGYLNDPEATAAAYLEGGWYRTGDVVRVDPERYVWVLDRARDMVIAGGENIFPAEVEAVLAEHPDVREAAVIGLPDQRWGEVVHAVVVPDHDPHADGPDLIAWTRERLAHFKCPRSISFVEVLPRTTTGKVLKRELRLQMTNPAEQPAG
jgi:long-chain acyl-CoA synthetase